MNNIEVTVFITNYNYSDYLEEAINSVLRQTFKNWELIIIDDGSSDSSMEIIHKYKSIKNVRVQSFDRYGLAKICNEVIKISRGNYIIRLDADDYFDPNILLIFHNKFVSNPGLGMVFSDFHLINQEGKIFRTKRTSLLHKEFNAFDYPPNGACLMIRKNFLKNVGGYRTDVKAQDGLDIWLKMKTKHFIENINLPLFYYRRHNKNLTGNDGLSDRIRVARHKIKKDNALIKIKKENKKINIIIPVRKYFDFMNDLWQIKIGEKNLLEISINTCLSSKIINKVIVVSDSEKVEKFVNNLDKRKVRHIFRDTKLTYPGESLVETCKLVNEKIKSSLNDLTIIKYIQSPFFTYQSLEESAFSLEIHSMDTSIAVEIERDTEFYKKGKFGLEKILLSQDGFLDKEKVYKNTNSCIAFKNSLLEKSLIVGPQLTHFEISTPESFFINSQYKLEIAKIILKQI